MPGKILGFALSILQEERQLIWLALGDNEYYHLTRSLPFCVNTDRFCFRHVFMRSSFVLLLESGNFWTKIERVRQ